MVRKFYIPERGDLIWVNFNPVSGHEQFGKRPAVVISPEEYNAKTNLALVVPITSQKKGYPFEVEIFSKKISGVALSDQVRSIDWKERKVEFISKLEIGVLREIQNKINKLIF